MYKVALQPMTTSNYFEAGHRIRIEVSSSNFPRFDRNLNTGGNNYDETTGRGGAQRRPSLEAVSVVGEDHGGEAGDGRRQVGLERISGAPQNAADRSVGGV